MRLLDRRATVAISGAKPVTKATVLQIIGIIAAIAALIYLCSCTRHYPMVPVNTSPTVVTGAAQ